MPPNFILFKHLSMFGLPPENNNKIKYKKRRQQKATNAQFKFPITTVSVSMNLLSFLGSPTGANINFFLF